MKPEEKVNEWHINGLPMCQCTRDECCMICAATIYDIHVVRMTDVVMMTIRHNDNMCITKIGADLQVISIDHDP